MLFLLYATSLLAWTTAFVSARGSLEFSIGTTFKPRLVQRPSPNHKTTNTVSLQRGNASSQSAEYLQAVRKGRGVAGLYSRVQAGNSSILSVNGGAVYLAPIVVGEQTFQVVIDTGSSDTWLIESGFVCVNPVTGHAVDQSVCRFGPSYDKSPTAHTISDENFNISYADGEILNGDMIRENITFANIDVVQQQMGVVDYAAWYGDSISSGLVGLAYPLLTNAYPGSDPAADDPSAYIAYDPLFTTMWERNQTLPIFSLALQRGTPNALSSNGGVLAIGGIPDIPHGSFFASAAIEIARVDAASGQPEYQFYTININGWALSRSASVIFDTNNTGNPRYTPLVASETRIIVDSGTSLVYAPEDVATSLAAMYSPPATFDPAYGLYTVDCDAKAPVFGIALDGKVFRVNPVDLIIQASESVCVTGVQGNGGGYTILGDVFMRNTLTVFDIGAAEVRFAARAFTSASV